MHAGREWVENSQWLFCVVENQIICGYQILLMYKAYFVIEKLVLNVGIKAL